MSTPLMPETLFIPNCPSLVSTSSQSAYVPSRHLSRSILRPTISNHSVSVQPRASASPVFSVDVPLSPQMSATPAPRCPTLRAGKKEDRDLDSSPHSTSHAAGLSPLMSPRILPTPSKEETPATQCGIPENLSPEVARVTDVQTVEGCTTDQNETRTHMESTLHSAGTQTNEKQANLILKVQDTKHEDAFYATLAPITFKLLGIKQGDYVSVSVCISTTSAEDSICGRKYCVCIAWADMNIPADTVGLSPLKQRQLDVHKSSSVVVQHETQLPLASQVLIQSLTPSKWSKDDLSAQLRSYLLHPVPRPLAAMDFFVAIIFDEPLCMRVVQVIPGKGDAVMTVKTHIALDWDRTPQLDPFYLSTLGSSASSLVGRNTGSSLAYVSPPTNTTFQLTSDDITPWTSQPSSGNQTPSVSTRGHTTASSATAGGGISTHTNVIIMLQKQQSIAHQQSLAEKMPQAGMWPTFSHKSMRSASSLSGKDCQTTNPESAVFRRAENPISKFAYKEQVTFSQDFVSALSSATTLPNATPPTFSGLQIDGNQLLPVSHLTEKPVSDISGLSMITANSHPLSRASHIPRSPTNILSPAMSAGTNATRQLCEARSIFIRIELERKLKRQNLIGMELMRYFRGLKEGIRKRMRFQLSLEGDLATCEVLSVSPSDRICRLGSNTSIRSQIARRRPSLFTTKPSPRESLCEVGLSLSNMESLRLKSGDVVLVTGKCDKKCLCLVVFDREVDDWEMSCCSIISRNLGVRSRGESVILQIAHDIPFGKDVKVSCTVQNPKVHKAVQTWFAQKWRFIVEGNRFPIKLSDGVLADITIVAINPPTYCIADNETRLHISAQSSPSTNTEGTNMSPNLHSTIPSSPMSPRAMVHKPRRYETTHC